MIVPAQFSAETVRAALDVLHPHGGVIESRILKTHKGTISGYFDNVDRLVEEVAPWNGKHNIYTPQPRVTRPPGAGK